MVTNKTHKVTDQILDLLHQSTKMFYKVDSYSLSLAHNTSWLRKSDIAHWHKILPGQH